MQRSDCVFSMVSSSVAGPVPWNDLSNDKVSLICPTHGSPVSWENQSCQRILKGHYKTRPACIPVLFLPHKTWYSSPFSLQALKWFI